MGERLLRKIVYLPRQMLTNLRTVQEVDGRDENELIRVALGTYLDAKIVQAQMLRNSAAAQGKPK